MVQVTSETLASSDATAGATARLRFERRARSSQPAIATGTNDIASTNTAARRVSQYRFGWNVRLQPIGTVAGSRPYVRAIMAISATKIAAGTANAACIAASGTAPNGTSSSSGRTMPRRTATAQQ